MQTAVTTSYTAAPSHRWTIVLHTCQGLGLGTDRALPPRTPPCPATAGRSSCAHARTLFSTEKPIGCISPTGSLWCQAVRKPCLRHLTRPTQRSCFARAPATTGTIQQGVASVGHAATYASCTLRAGPLKAKNCGHAGGRRAWVGQRQRVWAHASLSAS